MTQHKCITKNFAKFNGRKDNYVMKSNKQLFTSKNLNLQKEQKKEKSGESKLGMVEVVITEYGFIDDSPYKAIIVADIEDSLTQDAPDYYALMETPACVTLMHALDLFDENPDKSLWIVEADDDPGIIAILNKNPEEVWNGECQDNDYDDPCISMDITTEKTVYFTAKVYRNSTVFPEDNSK